MATRAQLEVYKFGPSLHLNGGGTPEQVLPVLLPFVASFYEARPGVDGAEGLLIARLAQYLCNLADRSRGPFSSRSVLGVSIEGERQGDLDYLYKIAKNGTVLVFRVDRTRDGGREFDTHQQHLVFLDGLRLGETFPDFDPRRSERCPHCHGSGHVNPR